MFLKSQSYVNLVFVKYKTTALEESFSQPKLLLNSHILFLREREGDSSECPLQRFALFNCESGGQFFRNQKLSTIKTLVL